MKKIYTYLLLVGISIVFTIAICFILFVRPAMNRLFNADRVAQASCVIGDFMILKQKQQATNLVNYINSNYPNILMKKNQLTDYYGRPIKFATSNVVNAIYIIVSSSGEDGIWETHDDVKREGYILKEGHPDAREGLFNR